MARPLHLRYAGALHHVTVHGSDNTAIFRCDEDRAHHLDLLAHTCERYCWYCHAYCLLDDHFQLLLEIPDANLAQGMRQLGRAYSRYFRRTHGTAGTVLQPHLTVVADKENFLLALARQIVLCPVRAGCVEHAAQWPWSSYRATAGLSAAPAWLITDGLLSAFGDRRAEAAVAYQHFIAQQCAGQSPCTRQQGATAADGDACAEHHSRPQQPVGELRRRMPAPVAAG